MKLRVFLMFCAIIATVNSCTSYDKGSDTEIIPFNKLQAMSYDDMHEGLSGKMEYTVLKAESIEYMLTDVDKIIYKNNTFYIMDWINRKVVAFDKNGNPVLSLSKRGRGPGEYLQITDFDIDDNKDLWIVDGQNDLLLHYSNNCSFIDSRKLPFEVSYIKCIKGGMLFFGLSPWNTSDYKGKKILLSDTALNIRKSMLIYDKFVDPNYSFPSFGFTDQNGSVLYHQPINDNVYKIDNEGEVKKIYNFDFGSRTVPDKFKKNIELYRDEFENLRTLVKSVYIDESVIIGSVLQGREIKDFIVDRKREKLYLQNEDYKGLCFMGVSDGNIIYRLVPGTQISMDFLPEEILSNMDKGNEVLALVKIGSIFR
ncbi:MAG: 6-bladed beta-propeller [Bacteroidales bacterium]|jgi:hypothetical protein